MTAAHQLTAILFADIQGYTAVMESDEEKAIALRSKFEQALHAEVTKHAGRVLQQMGDGALCVFQSAIEAVRAAIGIQKQMITEPQVPLRIGIHSGDVIFETDNVYGDGVNIASRIESFAVAGAVFVSGKVYDEIKNQKDISAVSLGKYELKNVIAPVEIFAITNEGLKIPDIESLEGKGRPVTDRRKTGPRILLPVMAIALLAALVFVFRDRFSIAPKNQNQSTVLAVLPFSNLSQSKEDEYFADGMCDEILTHLSKIGELNVVSRTSTLQYKDTRKSIRQIGRELGADVLLEGSVQKAGEQFRINVQLVDAKDDKHLWAETYDRPTKDVFTIQSDIAKQIAEALDATLTETEKSLFNMAPTGNVEAYDFYLRGNKAIQDFWNYYRGDDAMRGIRMYEKAIQLDPRFTAPYDALVEGYVRVYWEKFVINSDDYKKMAKQWLDSLLALNIDDAYTHNALAFYKFKGEGDYTGALAELDVVDSKLGNGKSTYLVRADILRRMGEIDASIAYYKKQAQLFPRQAEGWAALAETYKLKRDFDSSVYFINKAIELAPDVPIYYSAKSMYFAELKGDVSSARRVLADATSLVDPAYFKSDIYYFQTLEAKYDSVLPGLSNDKASLGRMWQFDFMPDALAAAMMYRIQGKDQTAKTYFQTAYDITSDLLKKYPDDFRLHATLGVALAGLGKKDEALREGELAITMMPEKKDAILGVSPVQYLALTYVQLGEQDKAIDLLEQLLNMPFCWTMSNTVPLYKLHYYWKPLNNNPRFSKLLQMKE
ncbi:MAG: tetratricopeptide repeat protein [Bacteroidetes bacterium]|nr:tetratricopeptide repeat protein [Bacteroidota bacterium]